MWMDSLTKDNEHWKSEYDPCPFYVRYLRLEDKNAQSRYFLNDYNIGHSHPLRLDISYVHKIKKT